MISAHRRGFMFGMGALLIADPKLIRSRIPTIWGDGCHDDWEGIQSLILGKPVRIETGDSFSPGDRPRLDGGFYRTSRTLVVPDGRTFILTNARLHATPDMRDGPMIEFQGQTEGILLAYCHILGNGTSTGIQVDGKPYA